MRALTAIAFVLALPAASFAQTPAPRAYADFAGGFAVTPDNTTSNVVGEAGFRVARNLFVFGNLGHLNELQPSTFQPSVDATTTSLSTGGLSVTGQARVPATYSMGGLRVNIPVRRVMPYVFGSAGVAHVTETAQFLYSSGTLPGLTPNAGDDVTSQLVTIGDFTPPAATNAFMFGFGGGIETPIASRLMVNVGYRVSRIDLDTPLNTQSVTFGVGYRF